MPANYEHIPPEREIAYLEKGRVAAEQAFESVAHDLGKTVLQEAEMLNIASTAAHMIEMIDRGEPINLDLESIPKTSFPLDKPAPTTAEKTHDYTKSAFLHQSSDRTDSKRAKFNMHTPGQISTVPSQAAFQPPAAEPNSLN